jgi:hypothetical protein
VRVKLGKTIDAALEILIERCLSKHPEDRFADASELARALGELRRRFSETPPPFRAKDETA